MAKVAEHAGAKSSGAKSVIVKSLADPLSSPHPDLDIETGGKVVAFSPEDQPPILIIKVPLAPVASGKYMSGRCDTDLRPFEQSICRRIQDAREASGKKCRGPADVLRFLLAQVAAAENEAKSITEVVIKRGDHGPDEKNPGKAGDFIARQSAH